MQVNLPACSQLRLSLVLNFSVFFFESLADPEAACKLTDTALNLATEKIDDLGDAEFRDVKIIMEQMKENTIIWAVDDSQQNDDY